MSGDRRGQCDGDGGLASSHYSQPGQPDHIGRQRDVYGGRQRDSDPNRAMASEHQWRRQLHEHLRRYQHRAVFTNRCSTATTTAATLTIFDQCLKDNSSGDLFQFNSATGQYKFTVCSSGFTLSGTGVIGHQSGILTLTDSRSDRKISAGVNTGSRTGTATIYVETAQGTWQTYRINDTNPSATCTCGT